MNRRRIIPLEKKKIYARTLGIVEEQDDNLLKQKRRNVLSGL